MTSKIPVGCGRPLFAMEQVAGVAANATATAGHRGIDAGTVAGLVVVAILGAPLRRVRTLVRVCSWSKTVAYEDEWISYDEYLRRRFKVDITHTISPDEYAKLMAPAVGNDLRRI